MLTDVAVLWIIGVVCLLAAIVGEALKLAGNELPALESRPVRIAVGVVGAIALLLGLVLLHASSRASASPAPTPSPSVAPGSNSPFPAQSGGPTPAATATASATPRATPPATASATSTAQAPAPPRVQWSGNLILDSGEDDGDPVTGWFLDTVPPSHAPEGDIGLMCDISCSETELGTSTAIAIWNGSGMPTEQGCEQTLNTNPGQENVAVSPGTVGCVQTEGGRYASFRVSDISSQGVFSLAVTVWAAG
jgi:hypothetical protein